MNSALALACWWLLGVDGGAEPPSPRRTAVLIVAGAAEDAELAENLAEVALARLADRGGGELVGTHELQRFLRDASVKARAPACPRDMSCLQRIATDLAVDQLVAGQLDRRDGGLVVTLSLVDPTSGTTRRQLERTVEGSIERLAETMQKLVDDLFIAPPASVALEVRLPVAAPTAVTNERPVPPPAVRRWAPQIAYGSAGLAALSFTAASIFGTLAEADASGATRAAAQRDLELRDDYASTTNVLWGVGSAFAILSVATFFWLWREAAPQ